MFGLANFHQLAATRGDGLRPELLALVERRHPPQSRRSVAELTDYRDSGLVAAGPSPIGKLDVHVPENVVLFPSKHRKEGTITPLPVRPLRG